MSDEPATARLIVEVTAGVLPDVPIEQYGRQWVVTEAESRDRDKVATKVGASLEYAALIRRPDLVNWVRHEWVWL